MNKADKLDIDIRFLLANERTLLAWVRTTLALIVGGLALTQLSKDSSGLVVIGIAAIVAGAVITAIGYARYRAADTAIRSGKLPSPGHGPALQVYGIIIFALFIAAVEIFRISA